MNATLPPPPEKNGWEDADPARPILAQAIERIMREYGGDFEAFFKKIAAEKQARRTAPDQ